MRDRRFRRLDAYRLIRTEVDLPFAGVVVRDCTVCELAVNVQAMNDLLFRHL